MLRIRGTHSLLIVANYVGSLFGWRVRNDATTEYFSFSQQHAYPIEAVDTGVETQIDMRSFSQTQDQVQSHETSPENARETQSSVAAENTVSEAGPSARSQNGAEVDAENTFEVGQSSASQNRAQAEDLQTGQRVAVWATEIAACGVLAVLAGFIGNQITSSTHDLFFRASMISLCASFAFGICILVHKIICPNIRCRTVVKILIIAAIGSISLAFGFGVTYYFRKD